LKSLQFQALIGLPEVDRNTDLPAVLLASLPTSARSGVLVVAQKIVSKAEGRVVDLTETRPGARARALAAELGKDARLVEVILGETRRIVRQSAGVLICETHHGLICANAGVDQSNAPGPDCAILLPEHPDLSARRIQTALGPERGVIITDTFGRPWREGLVDVAIGVSGIRALDSAIGTSDRSGRPLRVTVMALADQIAAGAGILMEKGAGVPAVWVEGIAVSGDGRLDELLRPRERDLFR